VRCRLHTLVLVGGLTACSFAPLYRVPESTPVPNAYRESGDWITAKPSDASPRGTWWGVFDDATLSSFEERASDANQNLKAAIARLAEARADTRIARADLFPSLSADVSATRARVSRNSPTYLSGTQRGSIEGNDFVLEADLSYEVDLWGRVRNQVAAARDTQAAQAADLGALQLSIQAEVADDYFALRTFDAQQDILDKTVDDYAKALSLVQALFDGGAAALEDLAQAKAQLHSAQTQDADVTLMRQQMEHALAVLMGENPSNFRQAKSPLPHTVTPPAIDPGMPSTLLERRPDVAEAERRVAAANAQIGVVRAAYFPQFTLAASGGFNSISASSWISAPSLFWSLGPQATLPIFEGGRLVAQTARAKAAYQEQVANYRNTVLTAYRDVEDNLAALRQLEQESRTQGQAVEESGIALDKALERYQAGLVTYLEVSSTETTALQAQLAQLNIQNRRLMASVLLIKALGGGWDRSMMSRTQ
jgi:NodT family efflux transporter outer membrane factor (OMF) lipoprotein